MNNIMVDTSLNKTKDPNTVNKINDLNKNSVLTKNSNESCHELLILFVKSSSFDSNMKKLKFDIRVEEVVNGVAKLELSTHNEERNEDVSLSWLEIDFNKREFRDITVDPDKPIKLKYDSNIFRKVMMNCKFK